jgi:MYXO-CTERM domain-containing protein
VRDTWSIDLGSNTILDAIQNNYTQTTETPGPLPLLGAGAAFGFSRRIRSRIKRARLA